MKRVAFLFFLAAVSFMTWFFLSSQDVQADACAETLAQPPSELWLTSEIYHYLRALDSAGCGTDLPGALDQIVEASALNLTSYALLEGRLGADGPALAPQLIAQFLQDYETTQAELDENAILVLIDIAYFPCRGNEACVGKELKGWTSGLRLAKGAQCLFGLDVACTTSGLPFVNDATLALGSAEARATRDAFFCARYLNCLEGAR